MRSRQREVRHIQIMAMVFVMYLAGNVPIPVLFSVDDRPSSTHTLSFGAFFVAVLAEWVALSCNWLMYGLLNSQFRAAFRELLCCKRGRRSVESVEEDANRSRTHNGTHNGTVVTIAAGNG